MAPLFCSIYNRPRSMSLPLTIPALAPTCSYTSPCRRLQVCTCAIDIYTICIIMFCWQAIYCDTWLSLMYLTFAVVLILAGSVFFEHINGAAAASFLTVSGSGIHQSYRLNNDCIMKFILQLIINNSCLPGVVWPVVPCLRLQYQAPNRHPHGRCRSKTYAFGVSSCNFELMCFVDLLPVTCHSSPTRTAEPSSQIDKAWAGSLFCWFSAFGTLATARFCHASVEVP